MNNEVLENEAIEDNSLSINIKKVFYLFIKRLFDIIAGLIGVILLIPITIIIKIAYMITGDFHSIFFVQERIGYKGRLIKIFKYRSMIPNAEEKLEELMKKDKKIKKEYLENKKLENDPRVTKLGSLIRKLSIDELPQFINVLIGNMSLVGPRPYLPREQKDMGKYYDYVISSKPGLTGLWQVSGRNDVSFKERLKLDEEYFNKKSLLFDIKIFFKTFIVVLFRKGAK